MVINPVINSSVGSSEIIMVTGEIGARIGSVYYMDNNYQVVTGAPEQITVPLGSMIVVTYNNLYSLDLTGATQLTSVLAPGAACAVLRIDANNFIIETRI